LGGAPDPGYNYPFAVNLSIFRQSGALPWPNMNCFREREVR